MQHRAILFAGMAACVVDVDPVPLATPEAWVRVTGVDDPFAGEGGDDDACDPEAHGPESFGGEDAYEIRTDGCGRLTIAQPLAEAVAAGEQVGLRAWQEPLAPGEPFTLALALDGVEIWRSTVTRPAESGTAVYEAVPVDASVDAGAQVAFHVHNHGRNSYHLLEVFRLSPGVVLEAP